MSVLYPYSPDGLEKAIGYKFTDRSHLMLALTHSSYCNEQKAKEIQCECNERLEFLGDSVLSYITSQYLYKTFPKLPEGHLSPIRAAAVCEKTLFKLAQGISLGDYLYFGRGESTSGRTSPSILADAFEALLAAIFLDGGIEPVSEFLLPRIVKEIDLIVSSGSYLDFKTELQQLVQKEKGSVLEYVTVNETGPAHKRVFEVEARLNGNVVGHGTGNSKRSAAQIAAREALSLFGIHITAQ